MGLTALFKGKSYQEDELLLSTVKQNRSKSEFIRAPADLKGTGAGGHNLLPPGSPRIPAGFGVTPEAPAAQGFSVSTGCIFTGAGITAPAGPAVGPVGPAPAVDERPGTASAAEATPSPSHPSQVHYTSISQFQQQVELYRGSVSTVYRGICSTTSRSVIIKCYVKAKMKPKNVTRMEREIKLMQSLGDGDCLVQLYGVFETDAHKYLVMEHCRGGDLFKFMLMRGGCLPEGWVCLQIIVPLLKVLVRMHREHVLHRDIKPENIFLSANHRFKLGDLGLAICSAEELPFTRSGTLDYMAPEVLANPSVDLLESKQISLEQLRGLGVRPYDCKVDVWAAGVLAYELVVGRAPFEVKDETQTATMIMFSNKLNFPSAYSLLWVDFVKQALEKKPTIRPTAEELLNHPWIKHHQVKKARQTPEGALTQMPQVPNLPGRHEEKASAEIKRSMSSAHMHKGSLDQQRPGSPAGNMAYDSAHRAASGQLPSKSARTPMSGLAHESRTPSGSDGVDRLSTSLRRPADSAAGSQHREDAHKLNKTQSRLGDIKPEVAAASFTALLDRAKLEGHHTHTFINSGEVADEQDRNKSGMRIRLKQYFHRQKSNINVLAADAAAEQV
ncbi:hypothetical protein WJX73_009393 [Symbiochloris irregularis]|uniref:Protein kinase domain-containing protein n=1 Tax=Symbiochloris irregularis TaxID=706552 RepID=A0AAW1NUY9_9CHLO